VPIFICYFTDERKTGIAFTVGLDKDDTHIIQGYSK
jgi:hypothetical protein